MTRTLPLSLAVAALLLGTMPAVAPGAEKEHDHEHHPAPPEPDARLLKFAALEGTWDCTATHHDGKVEKQTVTYRPTSAGTAVIETMFVGHPHEMVTVYYIDNDELAMTHYCAIGNQPHMIGKTSQSDPDTFVFECVGGGNIDQDMKTPHMHKASYTFKSDDHVESRWAFYADGEPAGTVTLDMRRAEDQS